MADSRPALLAALAALTALFSLHAKAAVPEATIPTAATRLQEVNVEAGAQYLWVDGQRLVAPGMRPGDGWHSSIYLIDIASAQPQKLMDQANIVCTVPDQQLFNVLPGKTDTDQLDRVMAQEGRRPQMHRWDAAQRKLLPVEAINPQAPGWCITYEQFNQLSNERPFKSIPLPAWSTRLRIDYEDGMNASGVFFEPPGAGKKAVRVDLPPGFVEQPNLPYIAFADEYLLSHGMLLKKPAPDGSRSTETDRELPLQTLTRKGELKRWTFESHFKRLGAPAPGYLAQPYAQGVLLMASGWRNEGAGVYTLSQGKLSRVWCSNPHKSPDSPKCDIVESKLSPDGCALAFYSGTTFDSQGRPNEASHRELIVLPLCGQTPPKPQPTS